MSITDSRLDAYHRKPFYFYSISKLFTFRSTAAVVAMIGFSRLAKWFGKRHLQYIFGFFAMALSMGLRTILSVAIIPMTDKNPPDPSIKTYPEWEDSVDAILSSFSWGYIVTQIGAGQLVERYGPKWFLTGSMLLGAVANTLIPVMGEAMGASGVMVCRVILGLNQGFIYPAIHHALSKWAPLPERSRAANFVYSGGSLGVVVSMPITGAISDTKLGWPFTFYAYGAATVLWSVLYAIFGADSPAKHSTISEEEKAYIEEHTKGNCHHSRKIPTPWRAIATSLPAWAILIALCGQAWGGFILLTEIPSYLSSVMKFDLKKNSGLSALPYLANWGVFFICGPIADKLVSSGRLRMVNVRKLFNSIGFFVPAIALIWLAFIDKDQRNLAVGLLVIAVGAGAAYNCGSFINHIDLSPNHVATLMGITNGFATFCSIMGPLTVGFLGDDKEDPILWRKVFCLAAGIFIGSGAFYVVYAKAELQPWNDLEQLENNNDDSTETTCTPDSPKRSI